VDRYGNLIDRHNLWEMVGVRFRRALFPGFSDAATYSLVCPAEMPSTSSSGILATGGESTDGSPLGRDFAVSADGAPRELRLKANLDYRKVDQYLLNFIFGEDSGITAPVIRMATDEKTVRVL